MKGTIGILAAAVAALGVAACQSAPPVHAPPLRPAIGATITRKSPRLGEAVENATCPDLQKLICTDNGFWARCRCSG
jgi:hypothetical protein